MKRLACALFAIAVLFSAGCVKTSYRNERAESFLELYGVKNSCVTGIDEKALRKLAFEERGPLFPDAYDALMDLLPVYMSFEASDKPAQMGSAMAADVDIEGDDGSLSKRLRFVVGCGLLNEEVEARLIGAVPGDVIDTETGEEGICARNEYKNSRIRLSVVSVGEYVCGPDTKATFDDMGIHDAGGIINYLMRIKLEETEFERYCADKDKLFSELIPQCVFDIDEEDLKTFARGVLEDYRKQADSFNTADVDAFGIPTIVARPDPVVFSAVGTADKSIRSILLVGALAQRYGIEVSEEEISEWLEENDYPAEAKLYYASAGYLILESKLMQKLTGR